MTTPTSGSLRLFRALGVDVYMHWSWFLVAFLQIAGREDTYTVKAWKVVEYVSLFLIVLLHEYGHALACKQVGGKAEFIILWPLGGIAYVAPPDRPGAVLWSIAAGPLVNVALLIPTWGLVWAARSYGWQEAAPDWYQFSHVLAFMNLILLAFNLIPAYPLDGGQILMAALWSQVGKWSALLCAGVIGLGFAAILFVVSLACLFASPLTGGLTAFLALFAGLRSLAAVQAARHFLHLESLPRHADCACPRCGQAPPAGPFWACDHCQSRFDLFDARGRCAACGAWYLEPRCTFCGHSSHVDRYLATRPGEVKPEAPVEEGTEEGERGPSGP